MNKNQRAINVKLPFPRFRHRSAGFILSGFAVSTMVTTGLLWVMYQLISTVQIEVPIETRPIGLGFVILKRTPIEPQKRERKATPPPVFDQPLPTSTPKWASTTTPTSFHFPKPSTDDLFGGKGNGTVGIGEREYMPLTEIQPVYPEKALIRGIEGTCVVIYTITKTGSVQDVRVDKSRCTSPLFHHPAVRAASKYKYAPRIVDGEITEARNVSKLFRFSITE